MPIDWDDCEPNTETILVDLEALKSQRPGP